MVIEVCVCGRCVPGNNYAQCNVALGYIDAVCLDGECVGVSPDCAPEVIQCSFCEMCQSGACIADPEKEQEPCIDTKGSDDAICINGDCFGSGPGFSMIDELVINVGLQESDLVHKHLIS